MKRQRRDIPLSHRTPDRCRMCGTDNLGTAESGDTGPLCEDCYGDRHDLHRLFQADCYFCWEQYRADRRLAGDNFLRYTK